ncbi:MAG: helix-turn-helix transcriptional regulator [Acidimicrobiales bacterium]
MTTRRRILSLLAEHPGTTVAELARELSLTDMAVRRHLAALRDDGLVESAAAAEPGRGAGRPSGRWRLSAAGRETLPRRYDGLAIELLDDLAAVGPEVVTAAFCCRTEKVAAEYRAAMAGKVDLADRVAALAQLRDRAGYAAEWCEAGDGSLVLTEHNCAVHRVAERHPVVCASELELLRAVLGPDVEVTRSAHTMAGDDACRYQIRPGREGSEDPL